MNTKEEFLSWARASQTVRRARRAHEGNKILAREIRRFDRELADLFERWADADRAILEHLNRRLG